MNRQSKQLWVTLSQAGLTEGEAPVTAKPDSPWYVKVLLAFSGWLAAMFLLGFIGTGFTFVLNNNIAALLLGGILIGAAFALLRIPKNEFFEHLALAVSLAGQALVVFAIFSLADSAGDGPWLLVVLLQIILAIIMPHFVHRVFSSGVAALAMSMSLRGAPHIVDGVIMLLVALCWLYEFRYPRQMRRIQAIGYGLVLAIIPLKATAVFGYQTLGWYFSRDQQHITTRPWMGELLIGMVALYVVWQLLQRYAQGISSRIAVTTLMATLLLCAVSMEVRGISVGMLIMLLGFAGSNRILLGLGIVSLLFYISSYYYLLEASLQDKSLSLLIIGLTLLVIHRLIPVLLPEHGEEKHV